jgi:hypothetical protein
MRSDVIMLKNRGRPLLPSSQPQTQRPTSHFHNFPCFIVQWDACSTIPYSAYVYGKQERRLMIRKMYSTFSYCIDPLSEVWWNSLMYKLYIKRVISCGPVLPSGRPHSPYRRAMLWWHRKGNWFPVIVNSLVQEWPKSEPQIYKTTLN